MSETGSAAPGFAEALRALSEGLVQAGSPWMCIGGVAVIASGIPRFTVDIDATVLAEGTDPVAMLGILARHGIHTRIADALEFAALHQILLLAHQPSGIPLDVSLAWLPFEEEAIRAAREVDFGGVRIRVARTEDLLVYKLVASRPRDLEDAERLLRIHGDGLDLDRVRRLVGEFCEVLEDQHRLNALERLIEASRG